MDRRTRTVNTAESFAVVIASAGGTPTSVSQATGIPLSTLNGSPELLTVTELGKVGGFLWLRPSELVAA